MTSLDLVTSKRFPSTIRYQIFLLPLLLVGANALVWTAYAIMGGSITIHADSLEAYSWGHEFQLGYYKHPPFWAWIAGSWFHVFPHKAWSFILLSEVNASLGILGAWALLGRFTKGPERLAGTLLLLLTTFYSFNAFRFNANTIQLSLWPWTMYFFVVSMEKKTKASGIAFGILCGLALLSKYYTALLLCSCLIAALIHRDRRAYFRSAAPWYAILTCSLVLTPHLMWIIQHQYQPIFYALGKKGHPDAKFADTLLGFLVICALYHALQAAVVGFVKFSDRTRGEIKSPSLPIRHGAAFVAVLALGPLGLTALAGIVGYRVTPLYVVPIFSLTPFLLLALARIDATRVARLTAASYAAIVTGCFVAAPFVPDLSTRLGESPPQPYEQISAFAATQWAETTPAHLRIVSGSWPYAAALTFYANGNVSEFTSFKFDWAPWITANRIKRQGLLVVCLKSDADCLANASRYQTADTRILETEVSSSHSAPALPFVVTITPPEVR